MDVLLADISAGHFWICMWKAAICFSNFMSKCYLYFEELTKRIKEVGDFLDASCDDLNVFSIGPILLYLLLNRFPVYCCHFGIRSPFQTEGNKEIGCLLVDSRSQRRPLNPVEKR